MTAPDSRSKDNPAVTCSDWLGPFAGFRLVESVHLVVQHRYPRTKNRRIRKKWAKRKENFKPRPDPLVNMALGVIYAHPVVARRLRAAIGPNGRICDDGGQSS
jgi:hypothetical protein